MNKGRAMALAVGVTCVGIVGFVGVYLPFYSQTAQSGSDVRRELHKHKLPDDAVEGEKKAGLAPSSMWKNMEKRGKAQ